MTLNARALPVFPLPPMPAPQPMPAQPMPTQIVRPVRPATELFGVLVLEAVMPSTALELPTLPDWEIRVWPVARLGDVTLEARPLIPQLGPEELRAALRARGWTPLGPVRTRRA